MLTEQSAGAVIFRKENGERLFLILHYEEGHWGASKGHVEKGESLEQTALREIREETGLTDVRFVPGFMAETHYTYNKNGLLSHKTATYFLAETLSREVRLSDEHVDYAWLPFSEAQAKVTFKSEKRVWESVHEFLVKPRPE
jgi:8-oxo-dGTP pyrophosphatase MutT (NUDIX family)